MMYDTFGLIRYVIKAMSAVSLQPRQDLQCVGIKGFNGYVVGTVPEHLPTHAKTWFVIRRYNGIDQDKLTPVHMVNKDVGFCGEYHSYILIAVPDMVAMSDFRLYNVYDWNDVLFDLSRALKALTKYEHAPVTTYDDGLKLRNLSLAEAAQYNLKDWFWIDSCWREFPAFPLETSPMHICYWLHNIGMHDYQHTTREYINLVRKEVAKWNSLDSLDAYAQDVLLALKVAYGRL